MNDGNYGCCIFVDFQKAFDIVNHDMLLKKLEHYSITRVSSKWFMSYLSNIIQYVSITGSHSNLPDTSSGSPRVLYLVF